MSNRSNAAQKAWRTRRRKQKKLSRAAREAWETRRVQWQNLRSSILLIECIPESDSNCSEAKMLMELFRIINLQMRDNKETVEWTTKKAGSREQLLKILNKAKQSCVHISCHGQYYKNYKKTGLKLCDGTMFSDQIPDPFLWDEHFDNNEPIPQLVFLSACETAHVADFCERFMQAGARYVIAPKDETRFSDAALFSSVFYTLVFVEQKNPYRAYSKIRKAFPTLSGRWRFYDAEKHHFKYYDRYGE